MKSSYNSYFLDKWTLKRKIRHFFELKYRREREKAFERGIEKIRDILSKEMLISDDMRKFENLVKDKYDLIIVGSDEVWKINKSRKFPNPYFLCGKLGCRKLSYAASAGIRFNVNDQEKRELIGYLSEFEFLSVRDLQTKSFIKENIGNKECFLSCDPSFLYDFKSEIKQTPNRLVKDRRINQQKETIVFMGDSKTLAQSVRRQLKNEYNLVSLYTKHKGYINIPDLEPYEWLKIISEADFVITTFFHGACFSIMNKTPFIAIGSENKKHKLEQLLANTAFRKNYYNEMDVCDLKWSEVINLTRNNGKQEWLIPYSDASFENIISLIKGMKNNE